MNYKKIIIFDAVFEDFLFFKFLLTDTHVHLYTNCETHFAPFRDSAVIFSIEAINKYSRKSDSFDSFFTVQNRV